MGTHYIEHRPCGADRAFWVNYTPARGEWEGSVEVTALSKQSECRCTLAEDEATAMIETLEEHELEGCSCEERLR